MQFHVNALLRFEVILRTKCKNENEQRAITPTVWCLELWFLCIAVFLYETNLHILFYVDALNSFQVMLQTKMGRTDERVDYYMQPFRGITIKMCFYLNIFGEPLSI